MSFGRRLWQTALLVGLVPVIPALGQGPKRVTVVGQAEGTGTRAYDEAVKAAQRQAVEQACGLFISAQSEAENFALVKDRILSQAGGYIREWNEKRRWTENGVTNVEIQAIVEVATFEREWAAFAHLKEDEGNPRMMMVIFEDNDVDDLRDAVPNGVTQSGLENFFIGKDVQLVDHRVIEQVRQRELTLADLDNNVAELAAAAAQHRAEVLVLGRAEARRGGSVSIGGRNAYRWNITLNMRAVQADSAAILMSKTYSPKKPYTTTSAAAGDDAFRRMIDDVAADVLRDIAKAWHKRSSARRILQVRFSDVPSRKLAKSICRAMAEHRGVVNGREGAKLREYTHGVANVEVDWKFDLDLLADTIEELAVEGLAFEVTEQTSTRLSVKAIQGG
ncbi:MAG: hypothetical protein ACE5GE_06370 [Phycisphaerae bacterium]